MNKSKSLIIIMSLVICCFGPVVFGQEQESDVYKNLKNRDPFIPLITRNGELRVNFQKPRYEKLPTKASLTGISRVKGVFYAIIDGELLKEGEMFRELKVTRIEPNRVILSFGDKKFELMLKTGEE